MLLALVYGVFLVLAGVTATALVFVSSMHVSSAMLEAVVSQDGAIAELFVDGRLRAEQDRAGWSRPFAGGARGDGDGDRRSRDR
jgi:hypothetical protein